MVNIRQPNKRHFPFKQILITVLVLFLSAGLILATLVLTDRGSVFLINVLLHQLVPQAQTDLGKSEGNLMTGIKLENIVLQNLRLFPSPNRLSIQELNLNINSVNLNDLQLNVFNARLSLPNSDPVLFYGDLTNSHLNFTVFTESLSAFEIKDLFNTQSLSGISADLLDVDIRVHGRLEEPQLTGNFFIEKLTRDLFTLQKAPCDLELTLKNLTNVAALYGNITLKEGSLNGPKTALINFQESRIFFNGDPTQPHFHVNATSVVDKIKITINLKGTLQDPDLSIVSQPSLPKERLLLALATNRTWKKSEERLAQEGLSPQLTREFLAYFLSGGQGNKFAEALGLKDLSVTYNSGTQGIGVSKDLSERLEGRYQIEKTQPNNQSDPNISQKIGGEYRLTDSLSVEAQKELKTEQKDNGTQNAESMADDQILFKFKKSF